MTQNDSGWLQDESEWGQEAKAEGGYFSVDFILANG